MNDVTRKWAGGTFAAVALVAGVSNLFVIGHPPTSHVVLMVTFGAIGLTTYFSNPSSGWQKFNIGVCVFNVLLQALLLVWRP